MEYIIVYLKILLAKVETQKALCIINHFLELKRNTIFSQKSVKTLKYSGSIF